MRKLVIAMLVVIGLLVAADRIGAIVTERVLAGEIRSRLALDETPGVDVRGIPFLTQALGGDYRDVRVTIADVDSGALQNIDVVARLQGVRVPLGAAVRRQVDEVPVDRITGDLTVRYDELARASGITGLRITREGQALRLAGTVQVLGRQIAASATGRVEVSGNDLVISADRAVVDGVAVPEATLDAAARLLSFSVSPRGLPLALRITAVDIEDDGLRVSAISEDAVLRADSVPAN